MKKFILAIAISSIACSVNAQSEGLFQKKAIKSASADMSTYEKAGAVPTENGKVVFRDVIALPGKSKEAVISSLKQWASLRYEANVSRGVYTDPEFFKNIEYAKVEKADANGEIVCAGAEELIFSIKPLAKNYTQAFYRLNLTVSNGSVEFVLHTLSFNIDEGEGRFTRVSAEEWITDEECLNKKGKLRRIPGKYRIKTIDLVNELKKEIAEAANK